MAEDQRLPAIYNHPNMAKHMHTGLSTHTRYGFIGGGRVIPGGVYPNDVRTRPDLYICANCKSPFVITATAVYCGNCSPAQISSLAQGKPASAKPMPQIVPEPEELPPPPDLTEPTVVVHEENIVVVGPDTATMAEESTPLSDLMLDIPRWIYLRGILEDAGIMTVEDIEDAGWDGLLAISGIGEKTAQAIFEELDL